MAFIAGKRRWRGCAVGGAGARIDCAAKLVGEVAVSGAAWREAGAA